MNAAIAFSPSKVRNLNHQHQLPKFTSNTTSSTQVSFPSKFNNVHFNQRNAFPSFALNSAASDQAPLVVVGSANADVYVEIDRLPKEGETIAAKSGQTLAGGKGANQAACGGKLSYPTYFVGQVM